ncbi:MAG TPA: hypothetical protein VIQ77_03430 [Mucilaginibacter sp.]
MKKTILTLAIALVCYCSYAQNTFPLNGNVGIGTTSPQGYLDIYTSSNTTTTPLISVRSNFHTAGNYGMIRFGDYTQTTNYQKGAIIYESVAGSARGKFHIALENTDDSGSVSLADSKLTVLSSGNVGIGTTSPNHLLTLNNPGNTGTYIGLYNTYTADGNDWRSWVIGANVETFGDFEIRQADAKGGNALTAGTPRFYIGNNGSVCIGTTDPHGYAFAVNGSAITTSMTVKLYASWPDYVFKKDYKLPSLLDVKTYIDNHQHLPDMPSEQEVKTNGINLGEMVKLQTKKLEELTLYAIQQKEDNQELKKASKVQEARIVALEKALLKLTGNK